jgi:hypothetical protein
MKNKTFLTGVVIFYMIFGFFLLLLPLVDKDYGVGMTSFFCLLSSSLCFFIVYVVGTNLD